MRVAKEVRANPTDLARLAEAFLTESKDLFGALKTARGEISLGGDVFGNADAAAKVQAAYTGAIEAAGTDVERLIAVCEEDMESLYQVAFAYQYTDQNNGQAIDDVDNNPLTP